MFMYVFLSRRMYFYTHFVLASSAAFDVVFKRLEKQLQTKQLQARKMAQCVTDTRVARDKIRGELEQLRISSDQDRETFGASILDVSQVHILRVAVPVVFVCVCFSHWLLFMHACAHMRC